VTADEALRELWTISPDCEPMIDAGVDQWWLVSIDCQHGRVKGVSTGPIDISTAFSRALTAFKKIHK
jgi:hypothetical protein